MSRLPRIAIVGVALACWSAGYGDVRVFVTSSASGYGLDLLGPQGDGTGTDPAHEDWPIDPFRPTYSTVDSLGDHYAYDYYHAYYRAAAYPPSDAPSGTIGDPILIDVAAGEWGYIWFQFRIEPKYSSIRGMFLVTDTATNSPPETGLTTTFYLQNNRNAPEWPNFKRWEGSATPPNYWEWHANPKYLLSGAGGAVGLVNSGTDLPENMFHRQGGTNAYPTGVGLLGAISGEPGNAIYEFRMTMWDYLIPPPPVQGEHAFFKFVPEPDSLQLVGFVLIVAFSLPRFLRSTKALGDT